MVPLYPKTLVILLAVAFVSPVLAGCLGDDPAAENPAAASTNPDDALGNESTLGGNATIDDGTGGFSEMDAGHLPHVHDYWNGRERVTILEERVDVQLLDQVTFYNVFFYRQPSVGGAIVELEDGNIVYEGTGKMLLTASWTDPTITGLGLAYRHAASNDLEVGIPLASGETVELEITPDMTDMAHQQISRWFFAMYASGNAADAAQGVVDFKIEIVKVRDVHVLPGHPVTYENTNQYDILDADGMTKNYNMATLAVAFATNTWQDDWLLPTEPVRMGTTTILAEVTVNTAANSAISEVNGVELHVRTAVSAFRAERATLVEELSDPVNGKYVFGMVVGDHMVDGPYEKESLWGFQARPTERVATGNTCSSVCGGAELQYHLKVSTYNHDPTDGRISP